MASRLVSHATEQLHALGDGERTSLARGIQKAVSGVRVKRAAITVASRALSEYEMSEAAAAPTIPIRGMRIRLATMLTANVPRLIPS